MWAYQMKATEDLQLKTEVMCCFLVGLVLLWLSLGAMLSRREGVLPLLGCVLAWHSRCSWPSVSHRRSEQKLLQCEVVNASDT